VLAVLAGGCSRDREPPSATAPAPLVEVVVEAPDGSTCTLCTWLADSATERQQGLAGVTDLAEADGMLFRYDRDTSTRFWMRDTLIPLDIAFYDGSGRHVGGATMTPCPDDATDLECPRYGADAPYRLAIEVAAGRAAELGLVPGSHVTVTGTCAGPSDADGPSSASAGPDGATLSR
jgi:uncharacterized membrane protein (UPF0127 family)